MVASTTAADAFSTIEAQAALLGRGERSEYLKRSAQDLGVSLATLYRKLESVSVKPSRKRRSDAGKTELKLEEAKLISAVLVEAMRRNGKRLMSVKQAVEMLRANGKIGAARIDEETGEVSPLSENTITRALREYKLHPDQISHFSDGLSCTISASRKFVFPVFGSIRHSGRRGLKVVRESRHSDARGVHERAAARKRRGGFPLR